ncbi:MULTISPECIES: D-alanyl-D-alanine-carboxypeptidase/endopeptidase AmpH [Microvirga]|uniref:D-alanyl-D-alanine- carboxypeptidase/endopeptidase AmpH n=1 Tax=Microvirga TaxID=186650 RepID=UPI001FFCEFD8|nr:MULTISPECIES: D-alanyl-D-alanine-carboxypeptidase/endopeptidase AmpH [unclassified Microvirga]
MRMWVTIAVAAFAVSLAPPAHARDRLLEESINFTGSILYYSSGVPSLIIGAVRNGETAVAGFGRTSDSVDQAPDGDTLMRVGSITKVFTGAVLASLVADGTVRLTDPLDRHLNWDVAVPTRDGRPIRLIDLVTHTSGLPREIGRPPSPPEDPMRTLTKEAFIAHLKQDRLLFPPGTGAQYSNIAFDLLAQALSSAAKRPYEDLLRERVLQPAGLTATTFSPTEAQLSNLMQGHDIDGSPMPVVPTSSMAVGSGGLYSSTNDILRWLAWHLDRTDATGAEIRLLDHAAYVQRDGLRPVLSLDESGRMDAIGLGWIIMRPEGDRPLILQKAGGLQGVFSYTAFRRPGASGYSSRSTGSTSQPP